MKNEAKWHEVPVV